MPSRARILSRLLTSAAFISIAGCAVGPDFTRPVAPQVSGYTPEALPESTASADIAGGTSQRFLAGQDVPADWWKLFQSEAFNALVDEALRNNADLAVAAATLRQASHNVDAAEGEYFPQADFRGGAGRQGRGSQPAVNLFNASIGVSYLLDIWGGVRRSVEGSKAEEENTRFEMEATYIALTANVLTTAIRLSQTQAQIAATQEIITAQTQELNLLNQQFELGAVARGDVLAVQSQLAQTQASLPALQKQLAQSRNLLAVLVGRLPSADKLEIVDLNTLYLPPDIPLAVPSKLVDQRPDIRAAEANLHVASANVGVAEANLLPQLTLTANYGSPGGGVGDVGVLFSNDNLIWNVAAGVTQPIFRGGTLIARRDAAKDAFDAAAARYRGTVLNGFQDVADALSALTLDADFLKTQLLAEQTAKQSLDIVTERFRAGAVSYISLLDAERTYQQARILLVIAQANRYADTVALFVALGGGWWNRDDASVAYGNNYSPTPAAGP